MTRPASTREWPLVAAGVVAGIVAAVLAIFFVVTRGGDAETFEIERETAPIDLNTVARNTPLPVRVGPLIEAREAGIRERLDALAVPSRPLRGPLAITAREVVWNEGGGARFVRADAVSASLSTDAARRGDIVLEDVVFVRPVVTLREDSAGEWNFAQVLNGGSGPAPSAAPNGDPVAASQRTILLVNIRIEAGTVDVTRPGDRFAFRSIDAQLPLASFAEPDVPEPYIHVANLTTEYVDAEPAMELAIDAENGLIAFPDGRVRFDVENAGVDDTRFADLDGEWNPEDPGYGVTATGRALGVDFDDIAFLLPDSLPRSGTAVFAFAVAPVEPDLTQIALTELDVTSGASRLTGDITMVIGSGSFELVAANLVADPIQLELIEAFTGPIPYDGTLAGTITGAQGDIAFDLTARLTSAHVTSPFEAGINGRVRFSDSGFVLQRAELALNNVPLAALRAVAPGLPLSDSGTVSGTIALSGPPRSAPLELDVRLELGPGTAVMQGQLDLTGPEPAYTLEGRLLDVDIASIIEPAVPPVSLSATFSLAGTGMNPSTMAARVQLDGAFAGWQSGPGDMIAVAATVEGGALAVDRLHVTLAGADVQANGTWWFVEPQRGAITYAADIVSLRPFGPYIPVFGDSIAAGSVRANGAVSGTLDRVQLAGDATGSDITFGAWRLRSFTGDYDVTFGGELLPAAVVHMELRDVVTPSSTEYTRASLALEMTPPGLEVRFGATRADGGIIDVAASGTLPETGQREIVVERARIDAGEDTWMLVRPTSITWTEGEPAYVHELVIEAERTEGRLAVDGYVLPLEAMDARFDIAALPVGNIQRYFGRNAVIDGWLWAEGAVRGGETDAMLDVTFRVDSGAIGGVALHGVEGTIVYADGETRVDAALRVDSTGALEAKLRLPSTLRIGGSPVFELTDGVPVEGLIVAEHFSLAALNTAVPQLANVSGHADMRVVLGGTVDAPAVEGELSLESPEFRVTSLNQTFTETTVRVTFDGRRLVIGDARVHSQGPMVISGEIVLERLTQPMLDLTITFNEFEPMGIDDHPDAEMTGEVTLAGPLDGLVLKGAIEIANGYVEIPQLRGPSFRPDLVDITQPAARDTLAYNADGAADVFGNLVIEDLVVDVAADTWFDAFNAQVQLSGELVVNKTGETFPIVGTLSGERGQYTLIAGPVIRRFDVISAEVQFRGEPSPDPTIDITVRRVVLDEGGRQMDVDVRITGTAEHPTLQLAGGTAGQVAESELLSMLLFGVPSSTLSGDQLPGDNLLGQTYVGAFWEIVSLELERSLGGLGLDIFQIRVGQGTYGFESPTIVAGRQIKSDVFLTVEIALNGLFDEGTAGLTTWAMRLDWRFNRQSQLRLAFEPVYRGRGLRSSTFALPLSDPRQQLLIELRRRWTY